MINYFDVVWIDDDRPIPTKHPFRVLRLDGDGYGNCATCLLQPHNVRHLEVVRGQTFVMFDDPEYSTKWISVPISFLSGRQNADDLADAVRAQLPAPRAAT